MLPHESCTLGSINLARMTAPDGTVDWARLETTAALATRFLDDVVDVDRLPVPALAEAAAATRKIGLGVMGLAEMLATLGIPYDSTEGTDTAAAVVERIDAVARQTSEELARYRGPFPRWPDSLVATAGIEPLFALAHARHVLGRRLVRTVPRFEEVARQRVFWSQDLADDLLATGRVGHRPEVPESVRRAWVTAMEIAPPWHLRMQAAVQGHVDAALSKTVNLPADVGPDDVAAILLDAWRAGLKGITVYRRGSRADQVLRLVGEDDG